MLIKFLSALSVPLVSADHRNLDSIFCLWLDEACLCLTTVSYFSFRLLLLFWHFFCGLSFLPKTLVYLHCTLGEKKKTKAVDNELNPVWNEVSGEIKFIQKCEGLCVGKC